MEYAQFPMPNKGAKCYEKLHYLLNNMNFRSRYLKKLAQRYEQKGYFLFFTIFFYFFFLKSLPSYLQIA